MAVKLKNSTAPKAPTGTGSSKKVVTENLPNVEFDAATQAYLNANFGSVAAWYNDPQIGPVLKAALSAGKDSKGKPVALQGQQYIDYIRTHAVDPTTGKVVKSAVTWWTTHSANVRTSMAQKISDPATFNANVSNLLESQVAPMAKTLGINLDPASLQKVAEDAFTNGWLNSDQIKTALLAQYHYSPTASLDAQGNPIGGAVGKAQSDFAQIAANYGIPVPTDPAKMQNFVKSAIGPGGTEDAFTQYAKEQAKIMYPFMSAALDAGATVKGYLQPYATQIANTLDIPETSINWQDPKWQSLVAKPDPAKPGITQPQTMNDVLTTLKTDPKYGWNDTRTAKNQAYDLLSGINQMFGTGQ